MSTFISFKKVGFVKENQIEYGSKILSTSDAVRACIEILDLRVEVVETMNLIALDNRKNICGMSTISRGVSTTTYASPKEIFRDALLHNAESIILVHNHPSGRSYSIGGRCLCYETIVACGETPVHKPRRSCHRRWRGRRIQV